jgi:phage terminase large subunit-like protein
VAATKHDKPYPGCPEITWTRPFHTSADRWPADSHFDFASGDRTIRFIRLLRHFKGEFAGQPFDLLPWQVHEVFMPLFGWKTGKKCSGARRKDGSCTCARRYRSLYLECGKKNGKTQIGAGLGGYLAFGDGESGAEVYTYAADKDQARLAFDALSFGTSYKGSPFEKKGIRALKSVVLNARTRSFVKVQTSTASTKHGPNAQGIIFDELHAQKTRELWDVVTTGVAARRQPLVAALTTAGWDRNSICWDQHEYSRQLAEGIFDDPSFLGVIYSAPEGADFTDKKFWYSSNPSLGTTVKESFYIQKSREAAQMPSAQNAFRQLFLSQWTNQAVRVIPLEAWDRNNAPVDREGLKAKKAMCYGGLDLSSTTDLSALALVFPGKDNEPVDVILKYWMPAANLRARGLRDRVPYQLWVDQGLIAATPGDVIDYDFIAAEIMQAKKDFDLREISYDPWNAVQLVLQLQKERVKMVPMRQGFQSISPPLKELLRMILNEKLRHGGNPVLRWNADSCAAVTDAAENMKLDKTKSTARIDGMVATVMGLDAMLRHSTQQRKSVYEDEGLAIG